MSTEQILFEILAPDQFRTLLLRYPGTTADRTEEQCENLVYLISGSEFIKDASELQILSPYQPDNTKAIVLTTPTQLHSFVGNVDVHEDGEESMYKIVVRDKEIELNANDLADIAAWRKKVLHRCGLVIAFDLRSHTNRNDFSKMVADVLNRATVVWQEEVSEEDMVADVMMSHIRKLPIVIDHGDFIDARTILDRDDMYLISTATIEKVLSDYVRHMRLSDIRKTLNTYLVRNSGQKTFDGHRMSVWFFKKWGED